MAAPRSTVARISAEKLRRIALDAQGLMRKAPFGRGKNATLRAIEQLGYVQIDTISVVARAHDHVLHTRVANYEPGHLTKLQSEKQIFEYWYHAAAYLPMRDYRFALPRMRDMREGRDSWIRSRDLKLMREVKRRIAAEGPLKARDFENTSRSSGGWWSWKPAKRALEQLFMQGDLMIAGRDGFQKTYDLTERILPSDIDTSMPDTAEMADHLLESNLRSHGFVVPKAVTHLRKGKPLRDALKASIERRIADEQLVEIRLSSDEIAYALPERLDRRTASAGDRVLILSPFDNLVIRRDRVHAVFDFDYQIECYVTESKRRYGYYCLPIVYRDRLVGRADCKAHRSDRYFEIKHLHVESLPDQWEESFVPALARAFRAYATFNGCDTVEVSRATPTVWRARSRAAFVST